MHGIILVFDVTDKRSLESIPEWIKDIQQYASEDVVTIIVGNKIDLDSERKVSVFEAKERAKEFNLPYFEVSAKSSQNVNDSFMALVNEITQGKIRNVELVFSFSFSDIG